MRRRETIETWAIIIGFLLFFILLGLLRYFNPLWFSGLPIAARSGAWAREFVTSDHHHNAANIQELADFSRLVLKVEVKDRRIEVFGRGRVDGIGFSPDMATWDRFYVHRLKVLDSFKDTVAGHSLRYGDVIEVIQFRSANTRRRSPGPEFSHLQHRFDLIPVNIATGDTLIVFLYVPQRRRCPYSSAYIPPTNAFAAFRHTRDHNNGMVLRRRSNIQMNAIRVNVTTRNSLFIFTNQVQGAYFYSPYTDVFESVNRHNNLTLTREDLIEIQYGFPPQ